MYDVCLTFNISSVFPLSYTLIFANESYALLLEIIVVRYFLLFFSCDGVYFLIVLYLSQDPYFHLKFQCYTLKLPHSSSINQRYPESLPVKLTEHVLHSFAKLLLIRNYFYLF